jgi:hypothetical protein
VIETLIIPDDLLLELLLKVVRVSSMQMTLVACRNGRHMSP